MTNTEIQKLVERLQDQDRGVRRAAARALTGQAGEPEVRAALLAAAQEDQHWWVRQAAAEVLAAQALAARVHGKIQGSAGEERAQ